MKNKYLVIICVSLVLSLEVLSKQSSDSSKPSWAQKDIRDYTDADIERLYEQWDAGEEALEDDELPEHLRKGPKVDFSSADFSDPENLLKMSKKGKTLMTFVTVGGQPTREHTERVTALWQTSLQNSHIIAERFLIDDNRAIFMFKDGSQAWDAKDFFVEQDLCQEVTIENKPYTGKYAKDNEHNKEEL